MPCLPHETCHCHWCREAMDITGAIAEALMPAGGTQQQGEALLNFSQSFYNFDTFRAAPQFTGWTRDTVGTPCGWSGITCDNNTGLLNIDLADQGLQGPLAARVCPVIPELAGPNMKSTSSAQDGISYCVLA